MSERYEERLRRLRVSFVHIRYVRVESFGCDDLHFLSSRNLRQRIECDYMSPMRSGSLRDVCSIIFVRDMLIGSLHVVQGIEHVHGVRSGKIRIG